MLRIPSYSIVPVRDVIACDENRKREDAPGRYTVQSVEDEFCHVGRAPLCFDGWDFTASGQSVNGNVFMLLGVIMNSIHGRQAEALELRMRTIRIWSPGRQAEALELRMRIIRIWRAPARRGGCLT